MELANRIQSGEKFSDERINEELRLYYFLLDEYSEHPHYDPYMCNKLRDSIKILKAALTNQC